MLQYVWCIETVPIRLRAMSRNKGYKKVSVFADFLFTENQKKGGGGKQMTRESKMAASPHGVPRSGQTVITVGNLPPPLCLSTTDNNTCTTPTAPHSCIIWPPGMGRRQGGWWLPVPLPVLLE
ncbi:hypothetical protein BaRGS_00003477 [Batillaria attramentaria]|uniref:Uncharacterized protein n=1 Tax=Batillaria attramentaria TaxID=370345 RepID=A0ABD0M0K7_9CAEN